MKKCQIKCFQGWVLSVMLLFCGNALHALDVSISIAKFQTKETPYIEVYYQVIATTIKAEVFPDSILMGSVKFTTLFKQNQQIVKFDNFVLNSPKALGIDDFATTKRYGLQPGAYTLVFTATDLNDESNTRTDSVTYTIPAINVQAGISDIQIFLDTIASSDESISKYGYVLKQPPYAYINRFQNQLGLFFEAYNTNQILTERFLYRVVISRIAGKQSQLVSAQYIPRKTSELDINFTNYDISKYESGTYEVKVLLCDAYKHVIDSAVTYFTRSNPEYDAASLSERMVDEVKNSYFSTLSNDELNYSLRAIAMLVPQRDVATLNQILQNDNHNAKTNFLFNHYKALSPVDPKSYYDKYMEVARAVDKQFKSGFGYGFETDRGLIYMKYGKPSDMISITDDASSPPYEIWLYYSVPKLAQSNVKFLFYNPFMDGSDYRLLHSNARGELNNKNWKKELYKAASSEMPNNTAPDRWNVKDNWNRHAEEWLSDL